MGRYVWEVYARYGNRPAGFVGRYPSRDTADEWGRRETRMDTVVKRVRISDEDHDLWARKGYMPTGWLGHVRSDHVPRRYTVRAPGCTAWAGPGLTLADAESARAEARGAGVPADIIPDAEAWR